MKACFYIGPGGNEWFGKFFPGRSPGELSIAGKSWCRHMVDQCSRLKITDIYIADCNYRDELLERLGDGDYWSLQRHYLPTDPCTSAEQLLEHEVIFSEDVERICGPRPFETPALEAAKAAAKEAEKLQSGASAAGEAGTVPTENNGGDE